MAPLLKDLLAGPDVDGEGGCDDKPDGTVKDGNAKDVPFKGYPTP